MFAVGHLAQSSSKPTKYDLKKAKQCLTYLRDSRQLCLYNPKLTLPISLEIYVDASFARGEGRKSVYGFVIMANKGIIHYRSKQQPIVTVSSTESEFVALSLTIREVKWILSILDELKILVKCALIFCDNQGAIRIVHNRAAKGRPKHVDIRLQYMKQTVIQGHIKVGYVKSEDNVADLFTKPLGRIAFHKLKEKLMHHEITAN